MDLQELQTNWNEFGKSDPLWAILTTPEMRGGKWKPEEFFKTGEAEIGGVIAYVESLGLLRSRRAALDFGCGVGRLTQALCPHFDRAIGVDIAPSMIEQARQYNRQGERCTYILNERDDLSVLGDGSLDFIYSNIVLQHMKPEYSRRYIREFARLLAGGGVAVFQIPSRRDEVNHPSRQPSRSNVALPASAFRARITPAESSVRVDAGTQFSVVAMVENCGDVPWPSGSSGAYPVHFGNHWRDEGGRMIAEDDARAALRDDLFPGARTTLTLDVTAPVQPGRYTLELDMVQEHMAWFGNKGSPTAQIPVLVLNDGGRKKHDAPPDAEASPVLLPHMEMYGIPREEVEGLLREAGVKVVDVREDAFAPGWTGFRYCVVRAE